MTQRPEYFRPALIAGIAAGFLSGLPFVKMGNCACCLWILGAAAIAAKMLAAASAARLATSDGAVVGALTGVVGAVVSAIVSIPFRAFDLKLAQRLMDWASSLGGDQVPSGMQDMFNQGGGVFSPGWFLLGLLFSAAVFAVVGALGGIIGLALFGKKGLPPAAVPPGPATPPPPAPGPSDAA